MNKLNSNQKPQARNSKQIRNHKFEIQNKNNFGIWNFIFRICLGFGISILGFGVSYRRDSGQVIILNTLLFVALSLTIIFGVSAPVLSSYATTQSFLSSKETFLLGNSAIEESLYRLKNGLDISNSETVSLDQGDTIVSIANTITGKEITIESTVGSFERDFKIEIITGVGTNFNYGIQTGNGGFILNNNAGVTGNVYANGSILGDSGAYITGSAVAAAAVPEEADQENSITGTPSHEIVFGKTSSEQDFAQSFTAGTTTDMGKISFYIKKQGNPSNKTVRIHDDSSDSPGTVLDSATLNSSQVTSSFGWVDVVFSDGVPVVNGTKYWATIDGGNNNSKYYIIGAEDAYPGGKSQTGEYNSSWSDTSPPGLDAGFRVFVGSQDSIIEDVIVGQSGVGDAYANIVNNVNAEGIIYCQSGTGNNQSCDTSRPNPSTQPLPLSDSNIDQFKSDATVGGVFSGNWVASSTSTLGPIEIDGNLTINDDLVITGTVYVTGDIVANNNASVSLSAGYGSSSGVIVTDGEVNLSNNVNFYGSGVPNSFILLITTSNCDSATCSGINAIHVSNNVGTVILNAQKGTIFFSNNSGAKTATANKLVLDNNAVVNYDIGLANINFSSGPGGAWNITSWSEVE
jgi:hypothetical protein